MSQTIAVFGAGAGLGQAVARRFGRQGFRVALVARNRARLDALVSELTGEGIEAAGFAADLTDRTGLVASVDAITARFGELDVVEYAPASVDWFPRVTPVLDVDVESLEYPLDLLLRAPITLFGKVLPGMRTRGAGALLMGLGESASQPYPQIGNIGIAMAAARSYQLKLNAALADTGVYAGLLEVGGGIAGSDAIREFGGEVDPAQLLDPADLAQVYWDMYLKRDRFAEVVRPPSI